MFDQPAFDAADGGLMATQTEADTDATESARTRARGLGPHVVLLWLVLLGFTWVVDVDRGVADADEGAFLMQVQQLAEEGTWWADHPGSVIDPDQRFVGVDNARTRDGEIVPFPVRSVQVWSSILPWEYGGVRALTLFGISGVVLAAWAVARIAAMIEPDAAVLSLWLAGLASPLAFQALVLQGHGITVGFAGVALLAVLCGRRTTDTTHLIGWASLAFACSLAASLVRREMLVFAVSLAIAGGIELVRTRSLRQSALMAIPTVGAAAGFALDRWLMTSVLELSGRSVPIASGGSGFVADRLESFTRFLMPGHPPEGGLATALVLAAAVVCIAGAVTYLRSGSERDLLGASILAAVLLTVRLLIDPTPFIAGIVPAFPLGVATLLIGGRTARREELVRVLLTTFGVFVVLTGLTQYRFGGGFEWGSRYLSVGLVAALPLCGVGMVRAWRRLDDPRTRYSLVAATLVIALAPTAMGLAAQRHARSTNAANLEAGYALARSLDTDVIISTGPEVPRVDTEHLTSGITWFWASYEIGDLLALLDESGHDEVVLFTRHLQLAQPLVEEAGWELQDVEIRAENPGTVALGVLVKRDAD